jgi:hypothetical protein
MRDEGFQSLIDYLLNLPQDIDLINQSLILSRARKEGFSDVLDRISKSINPRLFQLENSTKQQIEEAFLASLSRYWNNLQEPPKAMTPYIELHRKSSGSR